jgi:uncharacterized DUF497 family protein
VATLVVGDFEWDDAKSRENLKKHGVSFEEAMTALADPFALEAADLVHPSRFVTIGRSALMRTLFVVHAESVRGGRIRLISARRASPAQRTRSGGDMKKADATRHSEDDTARYDWAHAKRGRLAARAAKASALLRILDADLAERFPDSKAVNDALRALLAVEGALAKKRPRGRRAA